MTQPTKPRRVRKLLLQAAAALGGGSLLAACSSGPMAGTPVVDAGLSTGDGGSDSAVGLPPQDAGDDAVVGILVDSGAPDLGVTVDAGTTVQDAGDTDSGIHGVIIHDAGVPIGTAPLDGG